MSQKNQEEQVDKIPYDADFNEYQKGEDEIACTYNSLDEFQDAYLKKIQDRKQE